MGNVDKGLVPFHGRPMVESVLQRLRPQVDEILINANRNSEAYLRFGYPVVADEIGGYAGPLAGLERGLALAAHPLLVTVPCDSPLLPMDLVARLHAQLTQRGAQLAVARTFDQPHPVFCLCRSDLKQHLRDYLARGGRKIDAWYATLDVVEVAFDDEAGAFGNVNTRTELNSLESQSPGKNE